MKGGTTEIAFVEDNTGYKWELIQKPADFLGKKRDPILHVRLVSISTRGPAGQPQHTPEGTCKWQPAHIQWGRRGRISWTCGNGQLP